MDGAVDSTSRTFVEVAEVWVPEGDKLVRSSGAYGVHDDFGWASVSESFAKGEGLPGKAWAEARPVILKQFEGSYFKRKRVAQAAALTAAIAIPVFAGDELKAVLLAFCSDDAERIGAIEIWKAKDDVLVLDDGYYGAASQFEFVSQHTHFPKGHGLPGGVWAANTPILMRDLGSGYRFIRAESAGKAGLTTGLGIPIPVPGDDIYILTLLSARGTPIAHRFEIWDARSAVVGRGSAAILLDGICAREGKLWDDENERRIAAWQGAAGRILGSGLPLAEGSRASGITAGYDTAVGLPVYRGAELAHIVNWFC
jgi:hypothetical protein